MMTLRRWKLLLGLLVVAPLVLLLHVCDRMQDGEWWYVVWFDNQRRILLFIPFPFYNMSRQCVVMMLGWDENVEEGSSSFVDV